MRLAKKHDSFVDVHLTRETPSMKLGLTFAIPPRIMASGWASGQYVVIAGGDNLKKHGLEEDDIVIACCDQPVFQITDLQKSCKGKTAFTMRVVRMPNITMPDIYETQRLVEKSLKVCFYLVATSL